MGQELRQVSGFHSVLLREFGTLTITQGDTEGLTIDADDEILPKINTSVSDGVLQIGIGRNWLERAAEFVGSSMSSHPIRFSLTVRELKEVKIRGAALVKASRLESENLTLILAGAGRVEIEDLKAQSLSVRLPGAGEINIAGSVINQDVEIRGVGSYYAPKLDCSNGSIVLTGAGKALLRVKDNLNIVMRGLGSIDYYGRPTVNKSVSGLGNITALDGPGEFGPDDSESGASASGPPTQNPPKQDEE